MCADAALGCACDADLNPWAEMRHFSNMATRDCGPFTPAIDGSSGTTRLPLRRQLSMPTPLVEDGDFEVRNASVPPYMSGYTMTYHDVELMGRRPDRRQWERVDATATGSA